ncbi:MAG TPA: lytic transglycosylase domain-containing protein [Hyphomicrobiaceae bacterium]|nr:lytic transglycosylase domain-containing protein [Hyphomicrobiaceae bacterium]
MQTAGRYRARPAAFLLALAAAGSAAAQTPPPPAPNPGRLAKVEAAAAAPAGVQIQPAKADGHKLPAPRPGALAREQAHVERYDKAIAAARDHPLSKEDAVRIGKALAEIAGGDIEGARRIRQEIGDPIAVKLIDWYRLKSGFGQIGEYREFLAANPAWPERGLITLRLEEALFSRDDVAAIKEQFRKEGPKTGIGRAALASAHRADGDEATAAALARKAWREDDIPAAHEAAFLERFGKLLSEADHRWRLDRLLLSDPRWSNERAQRAAVIRRMIPLLSKVEQQKAQARLAVFLRAANAQKMMNALAGKSAEDWGMTFQRAQMLRRANKGAEAWQLLLSAPTDGEQIVAPDGWWAERRASAYEALKAGKPRVAYDIVREAGPLSDNPRNDQAFLAGWLALRHLNDAKAALAHFTAFVEAADGPLSRSKALYWLGRAHEALGERAQALANYRAAAKYIDTFHGQMARRRLGPEAATIEISYPAAPSPEEIRRFNELDAVRAAVIAYKAGLDRSIVRSFLAHLQRVMSSEAEVAMTAHLAEAFGDTQMAVRIGKAGVARGFNLIVYSYPVHAFPAYTPLREPPETALLLGIARQESEFNSEIISGAGARGILQVMPITARHVCRDYKLKCDIKRLLTDPSYNTMISSAYIADRMSEFDGSYLLGIAGYNAGPGRARQWIGEFGDPRDPGVDPEDWIHRIPFEETRDYVQKVLSNLQVYRARLGEGPSQLRIADDLMRARRTKTAVTKSADNR